MALVNDIEKVEREYAELHDRLLTTDKTEDQVTPVFAQVNLQLSQELEESMNAFFVEFIPLIYMVSLRKTAPALGYTIEPDTVPDFAQKEIDRLVDQNKSTAKLRAKHTRIFKAFDANSIFTLKDRKNFELDSIEAKIKNGIVEGKTFKSLALDVENDFRDRFEALDKNKEYMFQTQTKKGHFQRVRFDSYAKLVVRMTESNATMDAVTSIMSEVNEDIVTVPRNCCTEDECIQFEDGFMSISGENAGRTINGKPVYNLPKLRAEGVRIFHPNCKHFDLIPYIEAKFDKQIT